MIFLVWFAPGLATHAAKHAAWTLWPFPTLSWPYLKRTWRDFPADLVVRNLPCNSGYEGSIPGWEAKPTDIPQSFVLQRRLSTIKKRKKIDGPSWWPSFMEVPFKQKHVGGVRSGYIFLINCLESGHSEPWRSHEGSAQYEESKIYLGIRCAYICQRNSYHEFCKWSIKTQDILKSQ